MNRSDLLQLIPRDVQRRVADSSVIAIGNFDGVHLGHRTILHSLTKDAHQRGIPSLVMTFEPHPVSVFGGREASEFRLMTAAQRESALREHGVDIVLTLPFSREFAATEAEDFVRILLLEILHCEKLHVGYDFNFGRGRRGGPELLKSMSEQENFTVELHAAMTRDSLPVSSTRVREAVAAGHMHEAAALLGSPWFIEERPARGAGRGRKMGIPTINQYPRTILLPPCGVYSTWLSAPELGRPLAAITNVGLRPTFGENEDVSVETFVIDDDSNQLDHTKLSTASAHFLRFIREERRFDDAEQLVDQIERDIEQAKAHHLDQPLR